MKRRTFFAFVAPSLALMIIFIAAPLVSVLIQSFYLTQNIFEEVTVESCTPGFPDPVCTEEIRLQRVLDENGIPLTETTFVGFDVYASVLQPSAVAEAFSEVGDGLADVLDIDFYKALRFTLTFTLITLPLVIGVGLAIALAVNNTVRRLRGPIIFVSLLPFIITPVIGALAIRWLFVGEGLTHRGAGKYARPRRCGVRQRLGDRIPDAVLPGLARRAICLCRVLCRAPDGQSGHA